jgi:D-alanyl-D-alanine carboxypeptidase
LHVPAIKFGKRVVRNYNTLLGRYPGTDGMKTGFICASGFNLVATAQRDGKHLIAVVLGAPSGAVRAQQAAQMLERGFAQNPLSWLTPSLGSVESLVPIDAAPPNLRDEMCGKHRKRPAADDDQEEDTGTTAGNELGSQFSLLSAMRAPTIRTGPLLGDLGPVTPIVVYTGPTRKEPASQVASAARPEALPAPAAAPAAAARPKGKAVAAAIAGPWTAFSSSALAASPPADLVTGTPLTYVPLPRARPRIRAKSAAQ